MNIVDENTVNIVSMKVLLTGRNISTVYMIKMEMDDSSHFLIHPHPSSSSSSSSSLVKQYLIREINQNVDLRSHRSDYDNDYDVDNYAVSSSS